MLEPALAPVRVLAWGLEPVLRLVGGNHSTLTLVWSASPRSKHRTMMVLAALRRQTPVRGAVVAGGS